MMNGKHLILDSDLIGNAIAYPCTGKGARKRSVSVAYRVIIVGYLCLLTVVILIQSSMHVKASGRYIECDQVGRPISDRYCCLHIFQTAVEMGG